MIRSLIARLAPPPPAAPPEAPAQIAALEGELDSLRKAITDLTTVVAAQTERTFAIASELADEKAQAQQTIHSLRTIEAQLRGELREAYTRIVALEQALGEERSARMETATKLGDVQAQLRAADGRLQKQRQDLDGATRQIAVLNDERAKYQGLYAGESLARAQLERERAELLTRVEQLQTRIAELESQVEQLRAARQVEADRGE
jgi:chromosome segregation ATPase